MKWYERLLAAVLFIVFSPCIIAMMIYELLKIPKYKNVYKNSQYYADFPKKFISGILYSPEYRFYNSAVRRKLPMKYVRQSSNGFEYFIYNETVFLFPDFDQIVFDENQNVLMAVFDGDLVPFSESYDKLLAKLDNTNNRTVKLLVERSMIRIFDLNETDMPDCVFVTLSYENAFDKEESLLKTVIPQNSEELYNMMLQTPDLCGEFRLFDDNKIIAWNLYENVTVTLAVDPEDCYFGFDKLLFGKFKSGIHWHPTVFDIYSQVCDVGIKGNVTVLRSFAGGGLLYSGNKVN